MIKQAGLGTQRGMASPAAQSEHCRELGLRVEDVPIADGPLSTEEWLVLITYVGTIGLVLKGARRDVNQPRCWKVDRPTTHPTQLFCHDRPAASLWGTMEGPGAGTTVVDGEDGFLPGLWAALPCRVVCGIWS